MFLQVLSLVAIVSALNQETAEFMEEWDQKMRGFVPDD